MLTVIIYIIVGLPALLIILHTIWRIIRHLYKFPMPEFMAKVIDNPLRYKIMPPDKIAQRHGLESGMMVLEVGPGNGTYTLAAARRVGENGRVVAIDIEPKMVARVMCRVRAEKISNVGAMTESVYSLPFKDNTFDAAYMIFVIGEIPDPRRAIKEIYRVLKPSGTLAFTEILSDPDYPLASTLVRRAGSAGFRLRSKRGNFFLYTLLFEKEMQR